MKISMRRLRRLSAATAAGAVVTGGLLLGSAPAAHAVNIHFVRGDQVDVSETRAKGHHEFTATGVHITTDASDCNDPNPAGGTYCANKAAGYFDVDLPLAGVGEPSMLWTPVSGSVAPGLQLRVDFDNDGNIDGTLVGETVYNGNWWLSNAEQFVKDDAPTVGGGGSAYNGPLSDWRAAFPDAQVFTSGWSLGSGVQGEGTLSRITLGNDRYYFQASGTPTTTTVYRSQVDTQYTRAQGHNVFPATGGIHVTTDAPVGSLSKAAGYFATNIPLSSSGAISALDFTLASGSAPGLQLVTDFDNDGTADGTLVSESGWPGIYWLSATRLDGTPVPLWLKDLAPRKPGATEPTVPGYSAGGGTPAEWRVNFPSARILQAGYSLGSGAVGDGLLTKVSVGLNQFTFAANRAPVAPNQAATTTAGGSVQVTLAATDPDGDALTYSSADATVAGNKLTYTAPKDFAGSKVVAYRATDPSGAFATGSVTITVTKASSATSLTVVPNKITTRSKHVRGKVSVTSAGAVVGGTVDLFDGATKIGTGVLDANGTVQIAVTAKLKKGTHTFKAVYAGSAASVGSQASVAITVKKAKK